MKSSKMSEEGLILCRTCLSSSNKLFCFSDLIVPEHYLKFLDITFNHYTSKYICYLCLNALKKIVYFKEQCTVVNKLFIELTEKLKDANDVSSAVICTPVFYNISQSAPFVTKLPVDDEDKALETVESEIKNEAPIEEKVTEKTAIEEFVDEEYLDDYLTGVDDYLEADYDGITVEENVEAKDEDFKMSKNEEEPLEDLDVPKLSLEDFNIIPYIKKVDDTKVKNDKGVGLNKVGIVKRNYYKSKGKLNKGVKQTNKIAMARADLVNENLSKTSKGVNINKVEIATKNLIVNNDINAKLNKQNNKMAMPKVGYNLRNCKADERIGMHKAGIPKIDLTVDKAASGFNKTQPSKNKEVRVVNFDDITSKNEEKVQVSKNGTLNNDKSKVMIAENNVLNPMKDSEEVMMDLDMSVDEEEVDTNNEHTNDNTDDGNETETDYEYSHDNVDDVIEAEMLDKSIKSEKEDDDIESDETDMDDPLSTEIENTAKHKDGLANDNTKGFSRMSRVKDRIRNLQKFANTYSVDIKYLSKEQQKLELQKNKENLSGEKFVCEKCATAFPDKEGYYKHQRNLHNSSAGHLSCDICFIRCTSKLELMKHINDRHLKLFTCTICGNTSKNKSDAMQHFFDYHSNNKTFNNITYKNQPLYMTIGTSNEISVRVPGQTIGTSNEISVRVPGQTIGTSNEISVRVPGQTIGTSNEISVRVPGQSKQLVAFECEICAAIEFSATALRKHKENVHTELVRCDPCGREFLNAASFNIHRQGDYCRVGYYPCVICGMHYRSEIQATRHLLRLHRKSYHCHKCNAKFNGKQSYQRHAVDTHSPSYYDCDFCRQKFLNYQTMIEHRRVHANMTHPDDSPFKCVECDCSFRTASNLSTHRRTHKIMLPYSCGECGAGFKQTHELSKHLKVHKAQRRVCDDCKEEFLSNEALLRHLESVHGAGVDNNNSAR